MHTLKIFSLAVFLTFTLSSVCLSAGLNSEGVPVRGSSISSSQDVSVDYVKQARKYRDEGRYELARQTYAQAISTCRSNANLEIIRREMDGVELLIRTMR